jgi:hypothetical protein
MYDYLFSGDRKQHITNNNIAKCLNATTNEQEPQNSSNTLCLNTIRLF